MFGRTDRVEDIGVAVVLLVPCSCHVAIVAVIVEVVVRILELDLRREGSGSGRKSTDSILVAVAHSSNKGRTDLAVGGSGRETKCGERTVGSGIGFHWYYGRLLWCWAAMESAESGVVIAMAIAAGVRHDVGVEVDDVGSCGRSSSQPNLSSWQSDLMNTRNSHSLE